MASKSYSAQFKFKVFMAALTTERSHADIARTRIHDIHLNTLSKGMNHVKENGAKVFVDSQQASENKEWIVVRDPMLGQKEVEGASQTFFEGPLGERGTIDEKVQLVESQPEVLQLLRALDIVQDAPG